MTSQQRLIALVAALAIATVVIAMLLSALGRAVDKWGRALSQNQEKSMVREPEQPPPPRAQLSFDLVPQDEATSLLMGTVTNTGDTPLHNLSLASSMERMIFAVGNFAYVDELHLLGENGELSLTPGSSTRVYLGSVKLAARLEAEYLGRVKHSPSPMLTISLTTPAVEALDAPLEERGNVEESGVATKEKPSRKKGKPGDRKGKMTSQERRGERERKKLEERRAKERKKIAREEKKRGSSKGSDAGEGEVSSPGREQLPPPPLFATFTMPLHQGFFPQADSQMLYFYKRDLLFERADTKGEVFKNTMTFDGTPTRNLYRPRGK